MVVRCSNVNGELIHKVLIPAIFVSQMKLQKHAFVDHVLTYDISLLPRNLQGLEDIAIGTKLLV